MQAASIRRSALRYEDPSATPVLVAQGSRYESGPASTEVLTDVTFSVAPGGRPSPSWAPSGSGKHAAASAGGLDTPTTDGNDADGAEIAGCLVGPRRLRWRF